MTQDLQGSLTEVRLLKVYHEPCLGKAQHRFRRIPQNLVRIIAINGYVIEIYGGGQPFAQDRFDDVLEVGGGLS